MIRGFKKRKKNQERLKKLLIRKYTLLRKSIKRGANLILALSLIGFVVFVGFTAVLSIKNISKVKEFEKNQIAKVDNSELMDGWSNFG